MPVRTGPLGPKTEAVGGRLVGCASTFWVQSRYEDRPGRRVPPAAMGAAGCRAAGSPLVPSPKQRRDDHRQPPSLCWPTPRARPGVPGTHPPGWSKPAPPGSPECASAQPCRPGNRALPGNQPSFHPTPYRRLPWTTQVPLLALAHLQSRPLGLGAGEGSKEGSRRNTGGAQEGGGGWSEILESPQRARPPVARSWDYNSQHGSRLLAS